MPHRRGRAFRRLLIFLTALIAVFLATGALYDGNAERTHRHHNDIGPDGIIAKAREQSLERGGDRLIVLVHGFSASPMTLQSQFDAFASRTDADIWAPLLAFHGRSLATFRAFDAEAIRDDLWTRMREKMAGYRDVVLIAHSFGGALALDLIARGDLPGEVNVVLIAPAVEIAGDSRFNKLSLQAFRLWAAYCDIVEIGCLVPNPEATDPAGVEAMYAQNIFFYLVPDPVLALFSYAQALRARIDDLGRPINIVMADNDNTVDFAKTSAMCGGWASCRMHVFPSGSHLLPLGGQKDELNDLLLRLADDPSASCKGLTCASAPTRAAAQPSNDPIVRGGQAAAAISRGG